MGLLILIKKTMYLNKVFIIGNLTRDPELKAIPSGTKVASFSLATNRVWKDANGAKQEAVEYHNCVVFGKQAESIAQWMKKGSSLLIEGRLQTRSWEDKEGKKQYKTEIVVENSQFGPKAGGGEKTSSGYDQMSPKDTGNQDTIEYPETPVNIEDIPF